MESNSYGNNKQGPMESNFFDSKKQGFMLVAFPYVAMMTTHFV
jgi:hypothetical protein